MSIDVDRSRMINFDRTGRQPAPMLVPDRLTVTLTVKIGEAAASALQVNGLEDSLMIEWEELSRSVGVYRDLPRSEPGALTREADAYRDVCRDLSRSIAGMPFNLTVSFCAPRRWDAQVGRVSWLCAGQGNERAADETRCLSLICGTTSATAALSRRRSSRGDRRR